MYFSKLIGLDKNLLCYSLKRRVAFMRGADFEVEDEYTEPEWKELLQQAYIHTSYIREYRNCVSKVLRVHCFSKEPDRRYLGFFTLRPVRDELRVLDFIYPNFNEIKRSDLYECGLLKDELVYLMGYKRLVHINGIEEKEIFTFPFFHQDSIVTVCAHADLLMLSKFLYYKGASSTKPSIVDIISQFTFSRGKRIPSRGLNVYQMLEICSSLGIHIKVEFLQNKALPEKKKYESLFHCLVDSGLPIIVAIQGKTVGHVVLVIGHTIGDSSRERRYVIYDDSGAFWQLLKGEEGEENYPFIGVVSFEDLIKNCSAILYPEYEKVYLDVFKLLSSEFLPKVEKQLGSINRVFFVDTSLFKKFIYEHIRNLEIYSIVSNDPNEEMKRFLWKDQPHYSLVLETLTDDKVSYLLLDSSRDVRHFLDFKRAVLSPVLVFPYTFSEKGEEMGKFVFPCLRPIKS